MPSKEEHLQCNCLLFSGGGDALVGPAGAAAAEPFCASNSRIQCQVIGSWSEAGFCRAVACALSFMGNGRAPTHSALLQLLALYACRG